jgi:hypothetical protein
MNTGKIRGIFEYEFRRGSKAAETARNINVAFGERSANILKSAFFISLLMFPHEGAQAFLMDYTYQH